MNLTSGSPGCTTAAPLLVCNVDLSLPPGALVASFTTYDRTNGSGNALSQAQNLPLTIVEGQPNVIPLILGGLPASLRVSAAGGTAGGQSGLGFTVAGNGTGTLTITAVDADGNAIIGAGAPVVQNVASDAPAQITASAAANAVTVTALANPAIAHVSLDVAPAAETGASTLSTSFTVQTRGLGRIYVVGGSSVSVYDATGTQFHPSGSFGGLQAAAGIAYNSSNGLVYVADQLQGKILAYDVNGNAQALSGNPSGLSNIAGLAYDAHNGLIYAAGQSVAFDANGNETALSGPIAFGYGITVDTVNDHIVTRNDVYDESGNQLGGYPFPGSPAGTADGAAFDAANDLIYVNNVYPTSIQAYDTSGNAAAIGGNFSPLVPADSDQIDDIAADAVSGNVFAITNAGTLYGFDRNGNALPAPWHNVTVGGFLAVVPAQ